MSYQANSTDLFEMTKTHWALLWKSGERHKYSYGHAAMVSGPPGQGGAVRLAARGALRIGAGLVSVVCSPASLAEHAAHLDAIMVKPFGTNGSFLDHLLQLHPSAVCVGPNLGLGEEGHLMVRKTLSLELPLCIDADAITLISQATLGTSTPLTAHSVMTPHEGELRRFIPEEFLLSTCRIALAKAAAAKAGCIVLYKGPHTIVAAPDGRHKVVSSNDLYHASWLATAGTGDVLAGFVTGLLARGIDAFDAAAMATHLHLQCSEICGPGLIAEDIAEALPKVFRAYDRINGD
jgi:hydroxyethylthiazole kinase-like uncharacterized protein yjeF